MEISRCQGLNFQTFDSREVWVFPNDVILEIVIQLLALFVTVGTFLPLIRCDHWLIRGWDFPRMQLFLLGIILFPCLFIFSFNDGNTGPDWIVIGMLTVAVGCLGFWIWPYTKLHPKQVLPGSGKTGIRILVSNVLMSNRESEKLIALIHEKKPDILVALETDKWWNEKLAAVADDYPHSIELPQEDTYGMVVRSRLELIDVSVDYIIRKDIPSAHFKVKIGDGAIVSVHAVHPKPPFPDEDETSTDRDAELLIVGRRAEEHGGPTIVLGDLNDVAWSHTTRMFQRISGLLDPRVGRGLFSTFHAWHWFMRWPLDHVFISNHFRVRHIERMPSIGSDHFPMFTDFSFEPEGEKEQEAPEPDQGDQEEADEKISAALAHG